MGFDPERAECVSDMAGVPVVNEETGIEIPVEVDVVVVTDVDVDVEVGDTVVTGGTVAVVDNEVTSVAVVTVVAGLGA